MFNINKMIKFGFIILTSSSVLMVGCKDNPATFGPLPPPPTYTVTPSDTSQNHIVFTVAPYQGFMHNWDFGTGYLSNKVTDIVYFPFAGSYTVKLSISGQGGATTVNIPVNIAKTDPKICTNIFYKLLSGGCEVPQKKWGVRDADSTYGNGPPSPVDSLGNGTSSWADPIGYWYNSSKVGDKLPEPTNLDDNYIFGLKGFTYKNECFGTFRFNWLWANKIFGLQQAQYADTTYNYIPNDPATWELEEIAVEDATVESGVVINPVTGKAVHLVLTLSNDNYLGYCSGVNVYQILEITENYMFLRHELADPEDPSATGTNRKEWRYLRLVSKQ